MCGFAFLSASSNCFTADTHVADIFPEHAVYFSIKQMTVTFISNAYMKKLRLV